MMPRTLKCCSPRCKFWKNSDRSGTCKHLTKQFKLDILFALYVRIGHLEASLTDHKVIIHYKIDKRLRYLRTAQQVLMTSHYPRVKNLKRVNVSKSKQHIDLLGMTIISVRIKTWR